MLAALFLFLSQEAKANLHGRDCPGRVVLWVNPIGAMALMLGTTFPRPGMGGYYAAKFSRMPYRSPACRFKQANL